MEKNKTKATYPGRLIGEISKLFHNRIRQQSEDLGFKNGYHQILHFLSKRDGVTQIEIAKDSHFKASTISVTLKKMEEEGLISRQTDANDLRQIRVYITEKGKAWDEMLFSKVIECETVLTKNISEEETAILIDILKKMRTNLLDPEGGEKA